MKLFIKLFLALVFAISLQAAPFVNDTFTDSNGTSLSFHTGEAGATWTQYNITGCNIQSNRLVYQPGISQWEILFPNGTSTNGDQEVITTIYVNGATGGELVVMGRYFDSGFYGCHLRTDSIKLEWRPTGGGSDTEIGTYAMVWVPGQSYVIKLSCTDAAKKVFLDGVQIITSADNSVAGASGQKMAFTYVAGPADCQFQVADVIAQPSAVSLTAGNLSFVSSASTSITVNYGGTSDGSTPYTFALYRSTSPGFIPGAGNLISSSPAFPYTDSGRAVATTYYYKMVVTDSVAATATSNELSATTGAPAVLTSGTLSFVSANQSTVSLNYAGITGGTAPYSYALHRSTTAGFTPSGVTLISSGSTAPTSDSPPSSAPYYYKVVATDSASASVTSNQIVGSLWAAPLRVGFLGDSITVGYNGTPPGPIAVAHLAKLRAQRTVTATTFASSGTKASDWVSGSSNLVNAKAAFASAGVTYIMVMLGANDAKDAVATSSATFQSSITSTVNDLVSAGYKVILNYSPWVLSSGEWSDASPGRLQSYQAVLDSLVNGTTILQGDKLAFAYFAQHPSELGDGVHPNATGDESLGTLWAAAIDRVLNPGGTAPRAFAF